MAFGNTNNRTSPNSWFRKVIVSKIGRAISLASGPPRNPHSTESLSHICWYRTIFNVTPSHHILEIYNAMLMISFLQSQEKAGIFPTITWFLCKTSASRFCSSKWLPFKRWRRKSSQRHHFPRPTNQQQKPKQINIKFPVHQMNPNLVSLIKFTRKPNHSPATRSHAHHTLTNETQSHPPSQPSNHHSPFHDISV